MKSDFQYRVLTWMAVCFGYKTTFDIEERNARFIEESIELVQAGGASADQVHKMVDYVYGRPVGEVSQEVGGVMITLTALCIAHNIDLGECAEDELYRIQHLIEQIRARQSAKPRFDKIAS